MRKDNSDLYCIGRILDGGQGRSTDPLGGHTVHRRGCGAGGIPAGMQLYGAKEPEKRVVELSEGKRKCK